MIKFFTENKNFFGKQISIKGTKVNVDGNGFIEVNENLAAYCPLVGFISADPNAKFESAEEKKKAEEVNVIIDSARKQAATIIADAKKEAELILTDAKKKKVEIDAFADEKKRVLDELSKYSAEQLIDELRMMGVEENAYKGLSKSKMIDLIIAKTYENAK